MTMVTVAWYRVRVGLVLLTMLCAGAGHALAQNPSASTVQEAARVWIGDADRGDNAASWRAAGKKFQAKISVDRWAEAMRRARQPLGPVVERAAISTRFMKTFPGAPDGNYAMVMYRTSFSKKTDSRETVTLDLEADGVWRVIGYLIQ